METILIQELFLRPFDGIEGCIEDYCSKIAHSLLKSLFILAFLKGDINNGFIKILLLRMICIQMRRRLMPDLKLMYIGAFIVFIMNYVQWFPVKFAVFFIMFMKKNCGEIMDSFLIESSFWFVFQVIFKVPDILMILFSILIIASYYVCNDKEKSIVDVILGAVLYLVLGLFSLPSPTRSLKLFDIYLLSSTWMLLKFN